MLFSIGSVISVIRPLSSRVNITLFPAEWKIPFFSKVIVFPFGSVMLFTPVFLFIIYSVPSWVVSLKFTGSYMPKLLFSSSYPVLPDITQQLLSSNEVNCEYTPSFGVKDTVVFNICVSTWLSGVHFI